MMSGHVLFIGFGYCARRIAEHLTTRGWQVTLSARRRAILARASEQGFAPIELTLSEELMFGSGEIIVPVGATAPVFAPRITADYWADSALNLSGDGAFADAAGGALAHERGAAGAVFDAVVVSLPPDALGERLLRTHGRALASRLSAAQSGDNPRSHIIYLSSTAVYGDHAGAWVDEDTPPQPTTERGRRRVLAESQWRGFSAAQGAHCTVLRLAGIYGPGRNVVEQLMSGDTQPLRRAHGRKFSRIHRDDIASVVTQLIIEARNQPSRQPRYQLFNLADAEPASSAAILEFAQQLIDRAPAGAGARLGERATARHHHPPETPPASKRDMRSSFQRDSKLVSGRELARFHSLIFPTYREGLTAIYRQITG